MTSAESTLRPPLARDPAHEPPSLPEVNASIKIPTGSWFRRLLAFAGPGYLVSVGYMDPGNWATDIAGGAQFGYTLLFVIMLSNLMAILLQALSARLGIATGRDLAQACRAYYPRPVNYVLWFLCELAIIAAFDAFLVLFLMQRGFRWLEAFIIALLVVIFVCFAIQIVAAQPVMSDVLGAMFVPSQTIVTNPAALYIAIGIIGATVMPHNLYLHSSIVQTRAYKRDDEGRREAIKFATIDSTVALMLALFVNASILIVAAVAFHHTGNTEVAGIEEAHQLLSPLLGLGIASTLFAIALLASGLNSTITATLAGQIVMEGFLRLRLPHFLRRLLTRGLAIIPVIFVIAVYGDAGTTDLLILSQVILSMQLPFAIIPLVTFVSDRRLMGKFVVPRWVTVIASLVAGLIVVLNIKLLFDTFFG